MGKRLMAWAKLETITLGSEGTVLTLPTFTAKTFMHGLGHYLRGAGAGGLTIRLEFNSDTGTNYAYRQSANGAADGTTASATYAKLDTANGDAPNFGIFYMINIAGEEKLGISFNVELAAAGAGTAPSRVETVFKWANTSVQITDSEVNSTKDNFAIDANLSALGTD